MCIGPLFERDRSDANFDVGCTAPLRVAGELGVMRDQTTAESDRPDGVNANVPWHVAEVRMLTNYTLAVRFVDGTRGEVDLSRLVVSPNAGIFAALRDPALFAKATVEDGVVTWPGELDLAPDAMYDEIRSHGRWTPV